MLYCRPSTIRRCGDRRVVCREARGSSPACDRLGRVPRIGTIAAPFIHAFTVRACLQRTWQFVAVAVLTIKTGIFSSHNLESTTRRNILLTLVASQLLTFVIPVLVHGEMLRDF